MQVLVPQKPNQIDTATFDAWYRAWVGTWYRANSGSGSFRLIVGGIWQRRVLTGWEVSAVGQQ